MAQRIQVRVESNRSGTESPEQDCRLVERQGGQVAGTVPRDSRSR